MRIAVVSDIHGNLTAFEAVLADLLQMSPDLVYHGGDLADAGSRPVEIVDRIRDLGWQGVIGNTDQMLAMPETLETFASNSPGIRPLLPAIREMAAATRELLGEERLAWLRALPRTQVHAPLAFVHASPESTWQAPNPEASDDELESVFRPLAQPIAGFGHIHRSFIRKVGELTVANAGSVSLSYDGDTRASYLLLEGTTPTIRRVEYNVDREMRNLAASALPHADWIAKILKAARPRMP